MTLFFSGIRTDRLCLGTVWRFDRRREKKPSIHWVDITRYYDSCRTVLDLGCTLTYRGGTILHRSTRILLRASYWLITSYRSIL